MFRNVMRVSNCSGCEACAFVCPAHCINMSPNEQGFLYPNVSLNLCLSCGKCLTVCPVENANEFPYPMEAWAGRNKDANILAQSTSGGFFTAATNVILKENGFVCGAVFDESFKVQHICSDKICDRDRMRGAKYVQSRMDDVYGDMKKALQSGRKVLFTGSPCQVAAVNRVFKSYRNQGLLFSIDIVCHGVPSPKVFEIHKNELESRYGKIVDYQFRDKKLGWKGPNVSICFEDGRCICDDEAKLYSRIYFRTLITRQSCFKCLYSNKKRSGDVTIGDFWGIEEVDPALDDDKGVSLIYVNTPLGKKLFDLASGEMSMTRVGIESCKQHNLNHPTEKNPQAVKFWKFLYTGNLNKIFKRTTRNTMVDNFKRVLFRLKKLI